MTTKPRPKRRGLTGPQRELLARAIQQNGTWMGPYRAIRPHERRTADALARRGLIVRNQWALHALLVPTAAAQVALERKGGRPVADRTRAPGEPAPAPTSGPKRTLRLGAHLDAATVRLAHRRGTTIAATVRDSVRAGLPTLDADAPALDADAPTLDADAPTLDADAPTSSRRDDANRDAGPIDDKRDELIDTGRVGADMPPTDRGE